MITGANATTITATQYPNAAVTPMTPGPLGRYLYEPDGAVIRSGALDVLAERLSAAPVSDKIAYLTGDLLERTPLATAFEIIDVVGIKKLAGYLRERGVGAVEILKRGIDVSPDEFRRGLKLRGGGAATVVLTRVQGRHAALVVTRIPHP